jgi:hypothetical protein
VTESYNCIRLDQTALEIKPDFAAFDFVIVWPFMQSTLAAHFMLEVLHGVGDEGLPVHELLRQRSFTRPSSNNGNTPRLRRRRQEKGAGKAKIAEGQVVLKVLHENELKQRDTSRSTRGARP